MLRTANNAVFYNRMRGIADKSSRLSWLFLLVYVPMIVALTFHHHDEAQTFNPMTVCQECIHHVHHGGHVYAMQHNAHDCVLCQLQNTLYTAAASAMLPAVAVSFRIVWLNCRSERPQHPGNATNTRAPPYSLIFC